MLNKLNSMLNRFFNWLDLEGNGYALLVAVLLAVAASFYLVKADYSYTPGNYLEAMQVFLTNISISGTMFGMSALLIHLFYRWNK